MGNNTKTFKRYDVAADTWSTRWRARPASVKGGGSLTTDGTNIYPRRRQQHEDVLPLQRRRQHLDAARELMAAASTRAARLVYLGGYIYVLPGQQDDHVLPVQHRRQHVVDDGERARHGRGRRRARDRRHVASTPSRAARRAFWRYDPTTNTWTTLASFTAATGARRLARLSCRASTPQGRFSSIDVSRSLGVTGDTGRRHAVVSRRARASPASVPAR